MTYRITITFIRHGESTDNPLGIWAGWKDAPLSALGLKQARALGHAFSRVHLDAVYSSPLLRAHQTAQALQTGQERSVVKIILNPKLREQHFGIAEGNPWTFERPPHLPDEEIFKNGIFPVLHGRNAKFPDGESLNDVAQRAEEALMECVLPHVEDSARTNRDTHIAITSHGLCISELIAALLKWDPHARQDRSYTGLLNTAWTRVIISPKSGADLESSASRLPLDVRVTDINNMDHLSIIEMIDVELDETHAQARAFFGGGGKAISVSSAQAMVDGGNIE